MSTRTVIFLLESGLFLAAFCIMGIFRANNFLTSVWIIVLTAEFFTTLPAPRLSATSTNIKFSLGFKTASENVIASRIF
jgi:hypothetical protein